MSEFVPPFWLRSPHAQSILPSLPLRRPRVERRSAPLLQASRELILDCGDGVRLQALHSTQQTRGHERPGDLVVLHHGWEGSADSLYILGLGQFLFDQGFDVIRLNLRDHGATHHLNRDLFHSCRIEEAVGAVTTIQRQNSDQRVSLVGFSLGGNFALRIGARAGAAKLPLHRIVAVSPVLDPEATLAALEGGFVFYHRYFVFKWVRSLRLKQVAWPGVYDFEDLMSQPRLGPMTDYLVRRYTDFPDMRTYLRGYAIVRGALDTLEVPSRLIAAIDDPMIPARDLDRLPRGVPLRVTASRFGGHCGFFDGRAQGNWVAREVLRELR